MATTSYGDADPRASGAREAHLIAGRRAACSQGMRTTVTLSDDVAAAVERLRRERSIGMSELRSG